MISTLRHLVVDSWLGRIIALLIFLAFVGWGVGDMVGSYNGDQANIAVKIGTRQIGAEELASAIQNEMPRVAQQMGVSNAAQLTPDVRQQVAQGVLQRMLAQNEALALADRNGMKVPDALVRNEIFAMSVFHGTNGQFDRKLFDSKLRQIHLTERDLLAKVRDDIGARNLLEGLGNGMKVPSSVLDQLIKYNTLEHRVDLLRLDSASVAVPVAPEEAQLRRFYDLHPWLYRSTEYRHAKIVLLTADSIARTLTIPDADLKRFYEFELQKYDVPETRNLEVLTVSDRKSADALVSAWKADGDWAAIQKRDPSAAAVAFPGARQADIPSPELAKAAFVAPSGEIEGPVESPAGWIVFRVTAITPPHKTDFEHAKAAIRDEVARSQAPQLLGSRVATLQDAIAGSADLEQIPTDLGAVPAQGSLDAQGMTKDGEIAPLPGSDAVRKAVIARIFTQKKGEKPSLVNGPEGSAFAVLVDEIEPGHVKPYEAVREQVGHDWLRERQMHGADERATTIMQAARKTGSLVKAVAGTGDENALQKNVVVSRMQNGGLPSGLLSQIFSTPIGETGMIADGDTLYVFTVNGTLAATAESTKALRESMQSQLQETMRADVPVVFVHSLEGQIKPKPNMAVLQQALKAGTGQE
ncbi:peptidyl-prolyl cis-trans isomerase [Asaia lannensis]|uniref:Parvulin-like PPIase n=1 Tax=Asaia lannensis NBRC 102526 TaxID=1307926 RepID=A0ABT1CGX3_9PROT|nr:peptidylprolyl isomerase [Asaia lannensis]MCO6159474.1 SurA N-terminal domain-containing protein [Asaia lannensis NBRC 102526]GBQ98400.1 peptidyl-prolyl cis-trans isomerase [Asaia lannensis NBRC 102526]